MECIVFFSLGHFEGVQLFCVFPCFVSVVPFWLLVPVQVIEWKDLH